MRDKAIGFAAAALVAVIVAGAPAAVANEPGTNAEAPQIRTAALVLPQARATTARVTPPATPRRASVVPRASIACVPYARMVTGIDLRGNAREWWRAAAGRFDRTQAPEIGAVLSFRASGGMRSGHVAVVEQVLGPRHILIHHANWEGPGIRKGTVTRGISVIDVSPRNDWTSVQVQTGLTRGVYGRPYPTDGFIHNRAPSAETRQAARRAAPVELAEAPSDMTPHLARHLSLSAEVLHARR